MLVLWHISSFFWIVFFGVNRCSRDRVGTGLMSCVFFFQAEDGIRDVAVTGVQTCALPISISIDIGAYAPTYEAPMSKNNPGLSIIFPPLRGQRRPGSAARPAAPSLLLEPRQIGRASCRERV